MLAILNYFKILYCNIPLDKENDIQETLAQKGMLTREAEVFEL